MENPFLLTIVWMEDGDLNMNVPNPLSSVGLSDTKENRDRVVSLVFQAAREQMPDRDIIVLQLGDHGNPPS